MKNKTTILTGIILILLSLTPILWFFNHPNEIINGLDTNFPLNPGIWFIRRLFIWNDSLNGGMHMGASVAGLFFHFLQVLPSILSFNLQTVQIFTFVFWFGAIVFSAYIFASTFLTKRRLLQVLFCVFYSFNIYLFNTWENSKVANLALVCGLPLLLSFLELFRRKEITIKRLVALQLATAFICAGSGINPAYFITQVFGLFIYLFVYLTKPGRKVLVIGFTATTLAITVASTFWLVPLVDFLFVSSSVKTLEAIGFTNWVASLSANTSLVNVIRLMGAWDWYVTDSNGMPLYIPYALNYFKSTPFIAMSFVLPLLSLMALCTKVTFKKTEKVFFASLLLLGVFFGVGLHEPTGWLFSIFLNKVPFFSFFRSPWYIFTPFTIIGLASLVILFFEYIFTKLPRVIVTVGVLGLLFGHMIYSYPLWTGKIFRTGRSDSFYVQTPAYVFEFGKWLENSSNNRLVTYPDDQLETFDWGYKGTDSLLGLLVSAEVYAPTFNYPNRAIESFLSVFYRRAKRGDVNTAVSMLPKIGVDGLLLKGDAQTLAPDISPSLSQVGKHTNFGPWEFIELSRNLSKVVVVESLYESTIDPSAMAFLSAYLPLDSAVVDSRDQQLLKFRRDVAILDLQEAASEESGLSKSYKFDVLKDGYYILVFEHGSPVDVNTGPVIDGEVQNYTKIGEDAGIIENYYLTKGTHTVETSYPTIPTPLLGTSESPYLSTLTNGESVEKRITLSVPGFDPFVKGSLSFSFKYDYGDLPEVQFVQSYEKAPLKVESVKLSKNEDWIDVVAAFDPVELPSKLEIIIKVPPISQGALSKSELTNLVYSRVVSNRLFVYETPNSSGTAISEVVKRNSTSYTANISGTKEGYLMLFKENYNSGWKIASSDYIGGKPVHLQANGMYNLWYVPVGGADQSISITFSSQPYYRIALGVSIIGFLSGIFILVHAFYVKNAKK